VLVLAGLHFHLFGVATLDQAKSDVHYTLGSTAALYLATFAAALFVLPLVWHKSFFAGIQWNGATALRLRWWLFGAGGLCFLLAMLDEILLPSPAKAPIDEMFRSPGAAWLMLAFGVTIAPFFEEIFFRGFLLPTLATAWDWAIEQGTGKAAPALGEHGHPQWSIFAMVAASIFTSLPFAALHADQQGHALGPFVLLFAISLLLCAVRLRTRSLASSVLVHASYNFLLFSFMFLGTGGFRHLDKM
jgi:membrane protease YdiL (CAAX protease family)